MTQPNTWNHPDIQQVEANLLTTMGRAAGAKRLRIETGAHERAKSAQTKTVAELIDSLRHSARLASETLRETSEIPARIADSVWLRCYLQAHCKFKEAASIGRVVRIQADLAVAPGDPVGSAR